MYVFLIYQAGMDYTAINTTLTFSVSMPTQVVTIPILDDEIVESDSERFDVTLTAIDPAVTLSIQTASVRIRDNDSKLIMGNLLQICCLWLHTTLIASHALF